MDTIEVQNNANLERLLISNPDMERKVRAIVKQVLREASNQVSEDIRSSVHSTKDAYRAVRHAVYKRVLGGNINIITPHRAGGKRAPLPPKVDRGHKRGGNRMARSQRTADLLTYYGRDRGFVLRFLNDGTTDRTDNARGGNRGAITPRRFFGNRSHKELARAAEVIQQRIDELVAQTFNQ